MHVAPFPQVLTGHVQPVATVNLFTLFITLAPVVVVRASLPVAGDAGLGPIAISASMEPVAAVVPAAG